MRSSCRIVGALTAALLGSAASSAAAQGGFACPTEQEVQAALTRYITEDYWSPGERQTWRIASVGDFRFEPARFGQVGERLVAFGAGPQPVCPVRVVFAFTVVHADGRVEETRMGDGKTDLFYRDGFGDWTFKIE